MDNTLGFTCKVIVNSNDQLAFGIYLIYLLFKKTLTQILIAFKNWIIHLKNHAIAIEGHQVRFEATPLIKQKESIVKDPLQEEKEYIEIKNKIDEVITKPEARRNIVNQLLTDNDLLKKSLLFERALSDLQPWQIAVLKAGISRKECSYSDLVKVANSYEFYLSDQNMILAFNRTLTFFVQNGFINWNGLVFDGGTISFTNLYSELVAYFRWV